MGKQLIDIYNNKIKKSWKLAFFSTIIIGLCTHIYKFTNTLLNHDGVFNYYSDQNILGSGRWFLSFACGISSYFDLPWINGIVSLIYIALVSVIIVCLFEIENPLLILLCSGIMVAYPSITETFFFEFTADGYMLAMLLAALSVYLSRIGVKRKVCYLISGICICFACGIYQAYVSFSLVLALAYFIFQLLNDKYDSKEYAKWIIRQVIIYILSLAIYFVIWKICMHFESVTATSYQGIDQVGGLRASVILHGFLSTVKDIVLFFIEGNIFEHGLTLYGLLNIIFGILFMIALMLSIIVSGIIRKKVNLLFICLCIVTMPFAICIWNFTSESIDYHPMMMGSTVILFILCAVLFEKWGRTILKNAIGLLLCAIIINNALQANICYFYMNQCYQESYATALEMLIRVRELKDESGATNIAVTGSILSDVTVDSKNGISSHLLLQGLEKTLIYDHVHSTLFMKNTFNMDLNALTEKEANELSQTTEVEKMGIWPAYDSVKVIGDTIVIKLNECVENKQ